MSQLIATLRTQLDRASTAREKIDALNALAWELRYSASQEGQALTQQALTLASETDYPRGLAQSHRNHGYYLQQQGRYAEALAHLLKAQAVAEAEEAGEELTLILWTLGSVYERLTNYPASVEAFLALIELCDRLGDRAGKAQALNGLGVVYEGLDELEKALANLQQALALYEELGMRRSTGKALNNLTLVHRRLGNEEQALDCGHRAMEIAHETDHQVLLCHVHNNLGTVYLQIGELEKALTHFEQALTHSREINYIYTQIYAQRHIGQAQWEANRTETALTHLQQALQAAETADAKSECFACHLLISQIHEAQGDLAKALKHYQAFHRLKEEVFNARADQTIKSLQLIHDVETAHREAELIREKNVALEKEIVERRRVEAALREHARRLETSNAELDAFAHTVAHDLKSPVTSLLGFSKVLLRQYERLSQAEVLRTLDILARSAQKIDTIIDALLLLAGVRKMEDVPLEPLDTGAIVDEALARLTELLSAQEAQLTLPQTWPVALGYTPWVEEAWVNYLSNAAKYGGTPPQITLGWDRKVAQSDRLRFWVRDRGAGIPPAKQAQLFAPFERLDQTRTFEGHGLGLSIVRRIVEKLGGTVGVESTPGAGSRFWFTLPAAPTPAPR
ncbi:MAG: sensor histidine kinase [Anaerolineae bacterium]